MAWGRVQWRRGMRCTPAAGSHHNPRCRSRVRRRDFLPEELNTICRPPLIRPTAPFVGRTHTPRYCQHRLINVERTIGRPSSSMDGLLNARPLGRGRHRRPMSGYVLLLSVAITVVSDLTPALTSWAAGSHAIGDRRASAPPTNRHGYSYSTPAKASPAQTTCSIRCPL